MNTFRFAIALCFMALPALAQTGVDLPRLTWPTETTTPATQGCGDPTQLGDVVDCSGK